MSRAGAGQGGGPRLVCRPRARGAKPASLQDQEPVIGERVDADPDTGRPNRSSPALTEGDVLASLAEIRTLIGIGRSRAAAATEAAADRFRGEELRRQTEARRLLERAALEARWAQQQAALALGAGARIEAMYGGYRLNPVFAGN